MKDRYKLNLGRISKDRKIMGVNEILADLNELSAKANPKPEEVRVSLGRPCKVVDLLNIFDVTPPKITMVKRGGCEWIEIAIPDGVKDVPYLYADFRLRCSAGLLFESFVSIERPFICGGIKDSAKMTFENARKVKP